MRRDPVIPDPARGEDPAAVAVVGSPSAWNVANYLTVLRIVLVPVFGWALLTHEGADTGYRWLATGIFAVAMVTDRIDGDLARSRGLVTNFGKVADPIADKVLVTMALVGLSLIGELWWWVTIVFLVREWGITLLRFWVIRHGVMAAGRGGKLKTMLQAIALGLYILPLDLLPLASVTTVIAFVLLLAALVVTAVTGVDYVIDALRLRQTSERAAMKRARRAGHGES